MKKIISHLQLWLNTFKAWWSKKQVDSSVKSLLHFDGFTKNLNPVIVTDAEGRILFYNSVASVLLRANNGDQRGVNLVNFIHSEDRQQFTKAITEEYLRQPYVAHGLRIKGLGDPIIMRLYQHQKHCIVIFESFQVNEEVLIDREERKWAERLQIMLFGISHELKTPLAIARGYTEMMEKSSRIDMTRQVTEALDRISLILNDMTEPVRELSDRQERIDLGHSIEMYCKTMPYIEPTKRYVGRFEADIEYAGGRYVSMSKPRFYQTLTNLFENAIRATDGKGEEASISIHTKKCDKPHHGRCVVMEFRDNGCGMTEDVVRKVFTPYFTTRGKDAGTGLGGYFIYQFVMGAGGSIDVKSKEGLGSTFTIHLPHFK